jgi:hypothetical protein
LELTGRREAVGPGGPGEDEGDDRAARAARRDGPGRASGRYADRGRSVPRPHRSDQKPARAEEGVAVILRLRTVDPSVTRGTITFVSRPAFALVMALVLAGCATRAVDVKPDPASPAEFATWSCDRIDDETELVQRRAADLAYSVDERSGNNMVALGVGLTVFWPALLAMRPEGPEGADLARLKGRYEALRIAAGEKGCPPMSAELPAARAAALPVAIGDRLFYEDRVAVRKGGGGAELALRLKALRRGEIDYDVEGHPNGTLRHDHNGNVVQAPAGMLQWPQLLRGDLELGQVVAGDLAVSGDFLIRARVRGQVVALGPQTVAGRRFDAAVVELFGDAQRGEDFSRIDGAMVVDRNIGVLLRLDLRSALPGFTMQRRLARIEPAP